MEALQRRMEGVVFDLASGSLAQRVQVRCCMLRGCVVLKAT